MTLEVNSVVQNGHVNWNLVDNVQKDFWTKVSEQHLNRGLADEKWHDFCQECSDYCPTSNPHHYSKVLVNMLKQLFTDYRASKYSKVNKDCSKILYHIAPNATPKNTKAPELASVPSNLANLQILVSNIQIDVLPPLYSGDIGSAIKELRDYVYL